MDLSNETLLKDVVANLPQLEAELLRRRSYKIKRYFPETGPYRRTLYPKMLEFFKMGAQHRERAMIAANRVGKTDAGSFELALHLTGEYPDWWVGKRFDSPINAWCAGTTNEKAKEILQKKLLGEDTARGTGMIPAHAIIKSVMKGPGQVGTVWVRHVTGGVSTLVIKSYDQGRPAFEGTEQHVIWLDEEPPEDVYTECILRTMATGEFKGGIVMLTFTPLQGPTGVVNLFLPEGSFPAGGIVPTPEDARA
jgi:phage terminase large subunit-like protein